MQVSTMFSGMDPSEKAELAARFRLRRVPAKEVIVEQGAPGNGLYLIIGGAVEVTVKRGVRDKLLGRLQVGELFGEMSLLNDQPSSATVKTYKRSMLLRLSPRSFTAFVSGNPRLLAHLNDIAVGRVDQSSRLHMP